MEKVMLTFENGIRIEADVNGDCYIVDEAFETPADLSEVIIHDGESETVLTNMKFVVCASIDGRYWFAFTPMSETELRFAEIEDALCELSMQ